MTKKILIVEDNVNNRLMLHDLLTHHGYQVLEAENGEEGLELARKQQPDLILMDIQMPVMDGVTVAKLLKEQPATSHLKIIALTSFAMKGDREKLLAAGFNDYVAKPINTRQLPRIIQWHLTPKEGDLSPFEE
jgi:two-component system, cell cycle response regulator DivK